MTLSIVVGIIAFLMIPLVGFLIYKDKLIPAIITGIVGTILLFVVLWRYNIPNALFITSLAAFVISAALSAVAGHYASLTNWKDDQDPDMINTIVSGAIGLLFGAISLFTSGITVFSYELLPKYAVASSLGFWDWIAILNPWIFFISLAGLISSIWWPFAKKIRILLIILVILTGVFGLVKLVRGATPADAGATIEAPAPISAPATKEVVPTVAPEQVQPSPEPTQTVTPTQTVEPPLVLTQTPLPTLQPLPAFTPVPPVVVVTDPYDACPKNPLGYHPDHQKGNKIPLIWKIDPYPADPNVICEYEAWFAQKEFTVSVPENGYNIVAFYDHGDEWDKKGKLLDECPEGYGAKCEGTFVATKSFTLKPGALVHVYVYKDKDAAVLRFLGDPNERSDARKFSFACDFLDYSQQFGPHDNRNINVPSWVPADAGSIFGHTGCVKYPGNPGELEINPAKASSSAKEANCDAPTKDTWLWTEGFWYYTSNSTPISFDLPSWISKVDYEDFNSGDEVKNAVQTVMNAGTARAYCK